MDFAYSDKEIEEKFLEYKEDDFSREVLVPLFKKMFGPKVEFVGGANEHGRDIIIEKRDEFSDVKRIVVQVKKEKWSSNSSKKSFQTLLTQMNQALSEPLISREDGNDVYPSSFIAITSYFIGQRVLEGHRRAYQNSIMGKEIKFLDGRDVFVQLKEHYPDLLKKIFGTKVSMKNEIYKRLNTVELSRALCVDDVKNIKDIYCASEFLVGGDHYKKYFNSDLSCENNIFTFHKDDIGGFLKKVGSILSRLGVDILPQESRERLGRISGDISTYVKLKGEVEQNIKDLSYGNYDNLELKIIFSKMDLSLVERDGVTLKPLITSILNMTGLSEEFKAKVDVFSALVEKYLILKREVEVVSIGVVVDIDALIELVEKYKSTVSSFNPNSIVEIKEYLVELDLLSEHVNYLSYFYKIITFKCLSDESQEPCKLSINQVFDTGRNITVLGGAGSGKTTNLKAYAQGLIESNSNRLVVFSTLSNVCKSCSDAASYNIEDGILKYFHDKSIDLSRVELLEELKRGSASIILDSIDEAVSEYPWVIDSIVRFGRSYPESQIIVSSRFSIDEINHIPFAHVSLLPFTKGQKKEFFDKWFCNEKDSREIIKHLEMNEDLSEIVVNPLSATILCVLKENGINLPETEVELYAERFNLLAGKFDLAKNIQRLKTSSDSLISAAQFIALSIHKEKKREFKKEELIFLLNGWQESGKKKITNDIVDDLLKSEILLINTDGKLTFGHLKFQEYLSSKEILKDRSFSVSVLFSSAWWHEIMILCAKGSRDIGWILNYALDNGLAEKHKKILLRITNESNVSNKESWRSKIQTNRFHEDTYEIYGDEFSEADLDSDDDEFY
jgi:energy-coupling factor transporter ATP-binding protein EcfA2